MKNLSEEQLQKVIHRIRQEGITREDLQHDIVDHISCLIENEMNADGDFEKSFEKVFYDFPPAGGLKRIQFEINYTSTEKIIIMKKLLLFSPPLQWPFSFCPLSFRESAYGMIINGLSWKILRLQTNIRFAFSYSRYTGFISTKWPYSRPITWDLV